MVILNQSISVTGASVLEKDGQQVQVAYMTANVPADGKVNINRAIQNKELFEAEKEEILKDFAAFDEHVYGLMPKAGEEDRSGADGVQ